VCPFLPNCQGNIPKNLWGKWKVTRELNTRTISCWGEKEAKELIGTTIEYAPTALRWGDSTVTATSAKLKTATPAHFRDENSITSANGSQVDFQQLGIRKSSVTQITIEHADARINRTTTEFPGDDVLVKAPDTIVFSVCNLWFEAKRPAKK